MVIDLESPYKEIYRKGYLREDKFGRKRLDLINSKIDRTTISYARYLVSVDLGYMLGQDFEVDHIDTDCSNDELHNLQVLSIEEHREKTSKENKTGRTMVELTCLCCGKDFTREKRNVQVERPLCSRSCNGKMSRSLQPLTLREEDIKYIKDVFIKSDRTYGIAALAKKFGVNKATLSKYLYN